MNLFSYLKTRIAILDVVSEYATLKKAGLYWKGQCPFHAEKTASFTVSPHKEIFYCFGCHVGGDVIAFIARKENCSQMEAAKQLIDRYQIELPSTLASDFGASHKNDQHYFLICQTFAQWCNKQVLNSTAALSYLTKRGLSKKSIEQFMIGYLPGGLSNIKKLTTDLGKQNILVDDLLETHILSRGKNILFSPFEERIIFPIADHLGRYCGFGGRTFAAHDTRPKYYNSHENESFLKGKLLFGLDRAKKEIQTKEAVFLVEGYTDCIAMAQYGFANTVATLGTACTLDHLEILARYTSRLYVLYDGDNAGQQAILRIGQLAWQASLDLQVVCLPSGEDPASYLTKGLDLNPLIIESKDIFSFFIETLGTGFAQKGLGHKMQLTHKILEMISKVEEPLKHDILLQESSKHLQIPVESLKNELNRLLTKSKPLKLAPEPVLGDGKSLGKTITTLENKIFFSIINNIHLITEENEEFLITYLPYPINDILKRLQEEKKRAPELGFIQFFESLEEHEKTYVSKTLLTTQEEISSAQFEQLVIQLQKKHWKVIVNTIKIKLEAAKQMGDHAQITTIMHDFAALKKKIIGNLLPE